jgi:hypothetical protein
MDQKMGPGPAQQLHTSHFCKKKFGPEMIGRFEPEMIGRFEPDL